MKNPEIIINTLDGGKLKMVAIVMTALWGDVYSATLETGSGEKVSLLISAESARRLSEFICECEFKPFC